MILKVFAVRDLKANAFLQPFVSNSNGAAMRTFGDACGEPQSVFYKHPEDFMLFEIGSYDDNAGLLDPLIPVKLLCGASDFKVGARVGLDESKGVPIDFLKGDSNPAIAALNAKK